MHLMSREANESHERRARCFLAHPTITNARTISWTLGSITYSPTLTAPNVFHSVSPSFTLVVVDELQHDQSFGLGIVPSRFARPDSPARPCTRSSGGRFRSGFTRFRGRPDLVRSQVLSSHLLGNRCSRRLWRRSQVRTGLAAGGNEIRRAPAWRPA